MCYNYYSLRKCKSYCNVEKNYIMYTANINLKIIKKKVTRKKTILLNILIRKAIIITLIFFNEVNLLIITLETISPGGEKDWPSRRKKARVCMVCSDVQYTHTHTHTMIALKTYSKNNNKTIIIIVIIILTTNIILRAMRTKRMFNYNNADEECVPFVSIV